MLRRQLAEALQKFVGRDDIASFALNRFDDHRGDFVRRNEMSKELLLDEVHAGRRARLGRRSKRRTIAIRIWRMVDARQQR